MTDEFRQDWEVDDDNDDNDDDDNDYYCVHNICITLHGFIHSYIYTNLSTYTYIHS